MAERCLCTSAGAFDCAGGGLPPAPDGACSCACHGGSEATDALAPSSPAVETTEESLAREVAELRSQLASARLRASQVPGLTAELDQVRWELSVAKGDETAGALCLAEMQRGVAENTRLLTRCVDLGVMLDDAMRAGLEECERLRADLARATAETVLALVAERAETLRRVRVALDAFGVADCDDPIDALEAVAEEVPQRDREATDEYNAAVLRARTEGRAAGLREALAIVASYQRPSASPEPTELDHIVSVIGAALSEAEVPRG